MQKTLLLIFGLFFIIVPSSMIRAGDLPPLPAQYWGTVEYNGVPVESGTIEAVVDDQVYSSEIICNGTFGAPPPGKNLVVQGQSLQGKIVYFRIVTPNYTVIAQETALWQSGIAEQKTLHAWNYGLIRPVFQEISYDAENGSLTITFDRNLDPVAPAQLKAGIKIRREQGGDFLALQEDDQASIQGEKLVIILAQDIEDCNSQIQVTASIIKSNGWESEADIIQNIPFDGACFIATAAYGSYLDPHVWTLRQFRDQVLIHNQAGQWFIKQYYQFSPPIAAVISSYEGLRLIVRLTLTPLVLFIEYPLAALAILLTIMMAVPLAKQR